jgi:hypothetical protein
MKLTRALLLSSKHQADSYEGSGIFSISSTYRYLVTETADGLRFQIFRMISEKYQDARKQERERRIPVTTAHVDQTFQDIGELEDFLRRHQIDCEEQWRPVEDEN